MSKSTFWAWLAGLGCLAMACARGVSADGQPVPLCDCVRAEGAPMGLSCDKFGYFVSGFEQSGTWMAGGGLVPLSHAVCCRPCLPHETPQPSVAAWLARSAAAGVQQDAGEQRRAEAASGRGGRLQQLAAGVQRLLGVAQAVAVHPQRPAPRATQRKLLAPPSRGGPPAAPQPVSILSYGCHPSSAGGAHALQCEGSGRSFVTGFSDAQRVSFWTQDLAFPLDQVECCSPAALLSNGDLLRLERCDCVQVADDKSCGANVTGRLLWGFGSYRVTQAAELLPVAPLLCCALCLGEVIRPGQERCSELKECSGHGLCLMGSCQCYQGWGSPDCSEMALPAGGAGGFSAWAAWLVIAIGLLGTLGTTCLGRLSWAEAMGVADRSSNDGDQAREPLLDVDEGSVGSVDTEELLEELEAAEQLQGGEAGEPAAGPEGSYAPPAATPAWVEVRLDDGGAAGEQAPPPEEAGEQAAAASTTEQPEEQQQPGQQQAGSSGAEPAPDQQAGRVPAVRSATAVAAEARAAAAVRQAAAGSGAAASPAAGSAGSRRPSWFTGPGLLAVLGLRRPAQPAQEGAAGEEAEDGEAAGLSLEERRRLRRARQQHRAQRTARAEAQHHTGDEQPKAAAQDDKPAGGGAEEGGGGAACICCMERAVQVVLIPCGHAQLCRHCSRRIDRCPSCRREISRRQRLFLAT